MVHFHTLLSLNINNNYNDNNKLYFHRDRVKKTMFSGTITNTFKSTFNFEFFLI